MDIARGDSLPHSRTGIQYENREDTVPLLRGYGMRNSSIYKQNETVPFFDMLIASGKAWQLKRILRHKTYE